MWVKCMNESVIHINGKLHVYSQTESQMYQFNNSCVDSGSVNSVTHVYSSLSQARKNADVRSYVTS